LRSLFTALSRLWSPKTQGVTPTGGAIPDGMAVGLIEVMLDGRIGQSSGTLPLEVLHDHTLASLLGEVAQRARQTGPCSATGEGWAVHATPFAKSVWIVLFELPLAENTRNDPVYREAQALKRVGRALTMHSTAQPMCLQVGFAIKGALDLACVKVWEVGATGLGDLARTGPAPNERQMPDQHLSKFMLHPLAQWWEHPEGHRALLPLHSGETLLGVLELWSKPSDPFFVADRAIHITLAEQVSLALRSAQAFESVERLATTDPLTGIGNHRTMQDFLSRLLKESVRSSGGFAAVMIDVDHFRKFNEEEGHDAGDDVLKKVAQTLVKSVRSGDLAARYGGEEFTLLLPDARYQEAMDVAERCRKAIESIPYVTPAGRHKKITASFGVALFSEHGRSAETLLKSADEALYQSKHGGRNRVTCADHRSKLESA
jgi:diguanylate cyclase (GGDEF)-like protein